MSIRRRLRKAFAWGCLLTLTIVVGGMIAAYHYVTDSETLSNLVRREAPRYLPGCRVDVGKVHLRPFAGEVTLRGLQVREPAGDSLGPKVAGASWIQVRYDAWAMSKGRFEPREVTVAEPTLRLRRKADGTWNLQGLLADPWPGPVDVPTPPILIQKGTVELSEEEGKPPLKLLRDVSIKVGASPGRGAPIDFDLTAKGDDLFDRVHIEGTVEPATGKVTLRAGELVRLSLSEALRDRLPAWARDALALAGLAGGEVDAELSSLTFDPDATPRLHYRGSARLRRGMWKCVKLPFTISDVSADALFEDGNLTIIHADGNDGATSLGLRGKVALNLKNPARSTFDLHADATNLELDSRLRRWLPEPSQKLWDVYFPQVIRTQSSSAGRVNVVADLVRPSPEAEVGVEVDVTCLDVSMEYRDFAYPVDHVRGNIHATRKRMTLDVSTLVGNRPLRVTGAVDDPGPNAVAHLKFDVESLPVDAALFNALPPEVRKVVNDFKPTGTVRGHANLERLPPLSTKDDPRGRVKFDAWIDLNSVPGCSITWTGLKYPVMNLTGKLEIHPDLWIFKEMRGMNGQAAITAAGQVKQVRRNTFKVDLQLQARNLPFDQQLRDALPKPWQVTWATLNPTGASDIDATVRVDPDKPARQQQHDRVVIIPRNQTGVKLRFNPLVAAGDVPALPIELRMDDVTGTFVYDNSTTPPTTMTDVEFTFQRAPVTFACGVVDVKDNGEFHLGVRRLEVSKLQLDEELRRFMPPVMAQFARRLDDRRISKIKADLGLGWSGKAGESAWCSWDNALVVLSNNKVSISTEMALESIQGQVEHVRGSFNGRTLDLHGKLNLDSVDVFDQQITGLTANLDVQDGLAQLDQIQGRVLGGGLEGRLRASLDATPRFSVAVKVKEADLQAYAMTQTGHQGYRGLVSGWIDISGMGHDPHALSGEGAARIVKGELGTLPLAASFFNVLKLAKDTRTAFDSAEVAFKINNGETTLDPVRLTGNAISLFGRGTLDVRGELDLKLNILAGRDALHVPLLSDLTRELSSQFLVVRVQGSAASPTFKAEPIPLPAELGKAIRRNREIKKTGLRSSWRTGLEPRTRTGLAARWFNSGE